MDYLAFLQKLIALGDKLPQFLVIVKDLMQAVTEGVAKLAELLGAKPAISHNAPEITPEVLAAEGQLAALLPVEHSAGEHGKIGDGTLLRAAWAFFQANPWILQLLLK